MALFDRTYKNGTWALLTFAIPVMGLLDRMYNNGDWKYSLPYVLYGPV